MKRCYGICWFFYGVWADSGRRCCRYYWFTSKKERSAWVSEGNPYRGNGFRQSIPSRDPELRALLREERREDYQGYGISRGEVTE